METGDKANPPSLYPAPPYSQQLLPPLWNLPQRKAPRAQQVRDTYRHRERENSNGSQVTQLLIVLGLLPLSGEKG